MSDVGKFYNIHLPLFINYLQWLYRIFSPTHVSKFCPVQQGLRDKTILKPAPVSMQRAGDAPTPSIHVWREPTCIWPKPINFTNYCEVTFTIPHHLKHVPIHKLMCLKWLARMCFEIFLVLCIRCYSTLSTSIYPTAMSGSPTQEINVRWFYKPNKYFTLRHLLTIPEI